MLSELHDCCVNNFDKKRGKFKAFYYFSVKLLLSNHTVKEKDAHFSGFQSRNKLIKVDKSAAILFS